MMGAIDDVRLCDKAIPPEKVVAMVNERHPLMDGLVAAWKLVNGKMVQVYPPSVGDGVCPDVIIGTVEIGREPPKSDAPHITPTSVRIVPQ